MGRGVAPQGRLDEPLPAVGRGLAVGLHFFLCRFGERPGVSSQEYNSGLFISKGIFVCELCKQGKMA